MSYSTALPNSFLQTLKTTAEFNEVEQLCKQTGDVKTLHKLALIKSQRLLFNRVVMLNSKSDQLDKRDIWDTQFNR